MIAVHDVASTYHVPLLLETQGLVPLLHGMLRLDALSISPLLRSKGERLWEAWKKLTTSQDHLDQSVSIALVGKYTKLHDSYLSVVKSLEHAAMACGCKLNLVWVDASHLEPAFQESSPVEYDKTWRELCGAQGILVPGGFDTRGTEGMITAANLARKNNIPYLGICLGMQIAVIEYARNVCNIPTAASAEFEPKTPDPLIIFMPEIDPIIMGATMRLGLKPTHFQPGTEWSKLRQLYESDSLPAVETLNLSDTAPDGTPRGSQKSAPYTILERHRHRYEVNPAYVDLLTKHGLSFVGKDDQGNRMEIMELQDHPWFVGVQFHPEFLSRVLRPSKTFLGFVAAAAASCSVEELLQQEGAGKGT